MADDLIRVSSGYPGVELDVNSVKGFRRSIVACDVLLLRSVVAMKGALVTSMVCFVIQPDKIKRVPPRI